MKMTRAKLEQDFFEIMDNIELLKNRAFSLEKELSVQYYLDRIDLIGKCFKDKNSYYKVIDLEINNEYRCYVLTFQKVEFSISEMVYNSYEAISTKHTFAQDIEDLGNGMIRLDSIMIRDTKNMEEITPLHFQEEYLKQCTYLLSADKFLKKDRMKEIDEYLKEEGKYNVNRET